MGSNPLKIVGPRPAKLMYAFIWPRPTFISNLQKQKKNEFTTSTTWSIPFTPLQHFHSKVIRLWRRGIEKVKCLLNDDLPTIQSTHSLTCKSGFFISSSRFWIPIYTINKRRYISRYGKFICFAQKSVKWHRLWFSFFEISNTYFLLTFGDHISKRNAWIKKPSHINNPW